MLPPPAAADARLNERAHSARPSPRYRGSADHRAQSARRRSRVGFATPVLSDRQAPHPAAHPVEIPPALAMTTVDGPIRTRPVAPVVWVAARHDPELTAAGLHRQGLERADLRYRPAGRMDDWCGWWHRNLPGLDRFAVRASPGGLLHCPDAARHARCPASRLATGNSQACLPDAGSRPARPARVLMHGSSGLRRAAVRGQSVAPPAGRLRQRPAHSVSTVRSATAPLPPTTGSAAPYRR